MPPRQHALTLQYMCSRKISIQIIDFLLEIEKEAVKIQKQQQNLTDPSVYTNRIVKLQQDYLELTKLMFTCISSTVLVFPLFERSVCLGILKVLNPSPDIWLEVGWSPNPLVSSMVTTVVVVAPCGRRSWCPRS